MDRAHTDYRGLVDMPFPLYQQYLAVMEGESLAADKTRRGKQDVDTDAMPGFEMETETELIEWTQ